MAISGFTASLTYNMTPSLLFILTTIAVTFAGVFISMIDDTAVRLFGYVLMAIGLGALTGPCVAQYTMASVVKIFYLTMGVSIAIGVAGAVYPKSVSHWGGFLLTGLWVLILGQFSAIFLTAIGFNIKFAMTALDWVGVGLFSLYIFYDMNQAMRSEYSLQSAVLFSIQMYLNIMNLFLRLLSSFGSKDDD